MFKRLVAFVILFLLVNDRNYAEDLEAPFTGQEMAVDGDLMDWSEYPLQHFEEQKFSIGLRNDSAYMYLLIATRDVPLMNMFSRAGVTLWLNESNKEKKDYELRFIGEAPIPEERQPENDMMSRLPADKREQMEKERQQRLGRIEITRGENEYTFAADGSNELAAVAGYQRGVFFFEFRIPLGDSESDRVAFLAPFDKKVKVGFKPGALGMQLQDREKMREEMKERMGGEGGMGGGGGMGRMGGGGMGGPPGGMGGRGMMKDMTKENWFSVKLKPADSEKEQ